MKRYIVLCWVLAVAASGCSKSDRGESMRHARPDDKSIQVEQSVEQEHQPRDTYPDEVAVEPVEQIRLPMTRSIEPRTRLEPTQSYAPMIAGGESMPYEAATAVDEPIFAIEEVPALEPLSDSDVDLGPADDDEAYARIKVFYGTDRARGIDILWSQWVMPIATAILAILFMLLALNSLRALKSGRRTRTGLLFSLSGICIALTVWFGGLGLPGLIIDTKINAGATYGNSRGTLVRGTCEVTIPKTHISGELEAPSLIRLEFREDQTKHVVLADATQMDSDEFYSHMQEVVADSEHQELLVFVHGYNVTFEDAARRTAQIAYDLNFPGVPVFFSWPSQGGLVKYTVDETNVEWCVSDLKQFLLELRENSGATSINLIAHSMGNRAMTSVLHELGLESNREGVLFNEVVLAAPDIDAEVFRRRIAPVITRTANHVTLYASANDQALLASKQVHGYARAGNSADGVVVVPGIETIDASEVDTSLLGHGYVGDCEKVLNDMHQMMHQSLRAGQRHLLQPVLREETTWWTFRESQANSIGSPTSIR